MSEYDYLYNLNSNNNNNLAFSLSKKNLKLIVTISVLVFFFIGMVLVFISFLSENGSPALGLFFITLGMGIYVVMHFKNMNMSQIILITFFAILFVILAIISVIGTKKMPKRSDYLVIKNNDDLESSSDNILAFEGIKTLEQDMDGKRYGFIPNTYLKNELSGEFTYSFWIKVCPENFSKNNKYWKNIFFKGDKDQGNENGVYTNKTPGVYLAPNTNNILITVACMNGPDEGNAITIEDIKLNTWFCITFVLESRSLDYYLNGKLEKSITLTGDIKDNNYNIYKGTTSLINGFDGRIAFLRYNQSALSPATVIKKYNSEKNYIDIYYKKNPNKGDDC